MKQLILDIDGVLLLNDSFPEEFDKGLIISLIEKYGEALDLGEVTLEASILKDYNDINDSSLTADEYVAKVHNRISLNEELLSYCEQHKDSFNTSLLSNNYRENVAYIENKYDRLTRLADLRVYSCSIGMKKPGKEIFGYVLEKLQARPEDCVFVDDRQKNVASAKSLGMIAVNFKGNNKELFKKLDRFFNV